MSNAPRLRPVRSAVSLAVRPANLMTPILDWHYKTGLRDYASGSPFSFGRAGQAVQTLTDGSQILTGNNWARNEAKGLLLEGVHRNYFQRDFTVTAGRITHAAAPASQTITIAATGSHIVWVRGAASVAVAAGTATGTGWGTATQASPLLLNITATGTITLTVTGGQASDIVQVQDGSVPMSYVPNPVGTQYTASASEGADTSGNGLSIALSQAMVDSLTGELCPNYDFSGTYTAGLAHDWSISAASGTAITAAQETTDTDGAAAVQRVTVGANSENKNNQIVATLATDLVAGYTYEVVVRAKRLSGTSAPRTAITRGGTTQALLVEEMGLNTWETHTYRFTAITSGVGTVFFGLAYNQAGEYLIKRLSIRRVLDSGQTNPGEGTIIQAVGIPWDSSMVPNNTVVPISACTSNGASILLMWRTPGGQMQMVRSYDGILPATIATEFQAGGYILISQFSAALGKMRVGLYNPTTGALTWGDYATYRGFFPIHSSNRLRFFYGGGQFPIYARALRWLPGITSDFETTYHAKELSL